MKLLPLTLIILALLLSSCNTSKSTPTVSPEDVQTQVAMLLTQAPTKIETQAEPAITLLPSLVFTPTQTQSSTPTYSPTNTPRPTSTLAPTNTPIFTQVSTLTIATATLGATATTSPTNTLTSASTLAAGDLRSKLGNPTFKDTFATDNNWPTGEDKYSKLTISNNSLILTGLSSIDGWRLTWPKVKNFYLEATIQPGTCKGGDRYGLIVRVPNSKMADQGYLVSVTCDGRYALRKWDGTKMSELIPWTQAPAIQAGSNKTNRVGLLAIDNKLTVYINGTVLKSAEDNSYSEGNFGLFVGANQTSNFTITVSEIDMWENPNP